MNVIMNTHKEENATWERVVELVVWRHWVLIKNKDWEESIFINKYIEKLYGHDFENKLLTYYWCNFNEEDFNLSFEWKELMIVTEKPKLLEVGTDIRVLTQYIDTNWISIVDDKSIYKVHRENCWLYEITIWNINWWTTTYSVPTWAVYPVRKDYKNQNSVEKNCGIQIYVGYNWNTSTEEFTKLSQAQLGHIIEYLWKSET